MGVVYKAKDTKLDRFVALKFILPHLAGDEEDKKRFIQEAKAVSALDHNNICTIHEIDETKDGQLFIAMAYYDGETLKKKIERGPLKIEEALDVASQVGEGLAKAHKQDIVHRDIKPANIMITNDGVVKIVDFGLAKLMGQTKLTRTGATFGTISYMSPEQARGDEVDLQTDIWSIGVVLYEMIAGVLPFKGQYDQAVIFSILNKTPMRVSKIALNIPRQLDSIIFKTLEKNPADRFLQAKEFQAALTEVKSTLSSSHSPARNFLSPLPWISLGWKLKKKKIALIMSGLAALLLMLALFNQSADLAQSDKIISVAVMPFENNTGDSELEWLSNGIPDMLVTNLSQSRYLNLIGLDRIARVLSKMGIENTRGVAQKFSQEFAQQTGAQIIIIGRLIQQGEKFRIIAHMYDLRPGEQMKPVQVEKEGLDNIVNIADQLSDQIRVTLEVEAEGTPDIAEEIVSKTNSVEAYEYYIRGQENRRNSLFREAISNLRAAIQIDPFFAHAYDELATAYHGLEEDSLALEEISKAIEFSNELSDDDRKRFLLNQARWNHDYDKAERYLKQLALLQPYNPEWHFKLGWHYVTHRRSCDLGILEYKRAITLDSLSQPNYYSFLGYAYLQCGSPEEAVNSFKKHVSLLPNEADSHDNLGQVYLVTGDYDLAYAEFKSAQKLNRKFTDPLLNLGKVHAAIGQISEATVYYEKYLEKTFGTEQEQRGYFFLAKLYFENCKLDEALTEIEKALALEPEWVVPYWLSGLIQINKGEIDSALVMWGKMEDILSKKGSDYGLAYQHHLKGKIHLATGQFEPAIEKFMQAIAIGDWDHASLQNDLAEAYFEKGDLNQAIEAYEKALEFNPNHPYSHYGLGQVYEKKNDILEAIKAYKTCLRIWKDADEDMLHPNNIKLKLSKLNNIL